jgi:hypothetical protein
MIEGGRVNHELCVHEVNSLHVEGNAECRLRGCGGMGGKVFLFPSLSSYTSWYYKGGGRGGERKKRDILDTSYNKATCKGMQVVELEDRA